MSSGYYPLDVNDPRSGGVQLMQVADQLAELLRNAGWHRGGPLPDCEGLTPEDAASDGQYVGQLYLALELIERAIKRPVPKGIAAL
jgi:hypothetical protein